MYSAEEILLQATSGQTSPDLTPAGTPSLTGSHAPKFGTRIPNRIFVGGIAANTSEQELKQFFSSYGAVKDSKIISDRAGVSKGYGFITFETQEDAEKILKKEAENLIFKDRKLNIGPAIRKQQDFAAKVYESPTYGTNGALLYANGVPYTYQNGMAFFQADGTASYAAVSAQPQAQSYQVMMQGGQAMYMPQGYTYPAAAQAANQQYRWVWPNQQTAAGQTAPAMPAAGTQYMQYVPAVQPDLMYQQNPQAYPAEQLGADGTLLEHPEGSMPQALEQQPRQPASFTQQQAAPPPSAENYPAPQPQQTPQYGAVYANPATAPVAMPTVSDQSPPQVAQSAVAMVPSYAGPQMPPLQQSSVSSPGAAHVGHLPGAAVTMTTPGAMPAPTPAAQSMPTSILVSQAQQSIPVSTPPQPGQQQALPPAGPLPMAVTMAASSQAPPSQVTTAVPMPLNCMVTKAMSPMAGYAPPPPAKRAMVSTPRKPAQLASVTSFSPRNTPPGAPPAGMFMKLHGQPLTPGGAQGFPGSHMYTPQPPARMMKMPLPPVTGPVTVNMSKPGEMGDNVQLISTQLTPPPTPKINAV